MAALTEAQLAERPTYVGASEVAALFGCHPYTTRLQLYLEKTGELPREQKGTDLTRWGQRLEPAIAAGIAEDHGWQIRKVNKLVRHPDVRWMGCLQDYEIVGHADGPAPFEIKNVNHFADRSGWILDDQAEAPLYIELQVQHQMACTGRSWAVIGMLRGGHEPHALIRRRDESVIWRIMEHVAEFGQQVDTLSAPPLDPDRDLKTMQRLYPAAVPKKIVDLSGEQQVLQAVAAYDLGAYWAKHGEALKDAAKATLLYHAQDAELVELGEVEGKQRELVLKTIERAGYTTEAVQYRDFRFKFPKPPRSKAAAAEQEAA